MIVKPNIKHLLSKTESSGLNGLSINEFLSKCPYSVCELIGKNRKMKLAAWRTVFSFIIYINVGNQIKASGITERNRSSITYNCNKVINWENDFALKEVINELKNN